MSRPLFGFERFLQVAQVCPNGDDAKEAFKTARFARKLAASKLACHQAVGLLSEKRPFSLALADADEHNRQGILVSNATKKVKATIRTLTEAVTEQLSNVSLLHSRLLDLRQNSLSPLEKHIATTRAHHLAESRTRRRELEGLAAEDQQYWKSMRALRLLGNCGNYRLVRVFSLPPPSPVPVAEGDAGVDGGTVGPMPSRRPPRVCILVDIKRRPVSATGGGAPLRARSQRRVRLTFEMPGPSGPPASAASGGLSARPPQTPNMNINLHGSGSPRLLAADVMWGGGVQVSDGERRRCAEVIRYAVERNTPRALIAQLSAF